MPTEPIPTPAATGPTPEEAAQAWREYAAKQKETIAGLQEQLALLLQAKQPGLPWWQNPKAVGIVSEVSGFLTLLSALPYELGPLADILSPKLKSAVASVGVFATLLLRLWKRYLEPKSEPIPKPAA